MYHVSGWELYRYQLNTRAGVFFAPDLEAARIWGLNNVLLPGETLEDIRKATPEEVKLTEEGHAV